MSEDIKTPLNMAFAYVKMMIDESDFYWAFHAVDLAIEAFARSFPEQKQHKQQLIDLRADRYNKLFNNKVA